MGGESLCAALLNTTWRSIGSIMDIFKTLRCRYCHGRVIGYNYCIPAGHV